MKSVVLIVEDHPMHARLFSEFVRAAGHAPVVALNGREGIAVGRRIAPQMVIVDVLLPDLDGREVIAQMRQHAELASTPVLAMSAAADNAMAEECLAAGANRFSAKPMRFNTLVEDLRALQGG
jgi:DNA-binding response OmpR family regulator